MSARNLHPIAYAFAGLALLRALSLIGLHVQARLAGMPEDQVVLWSGISLSVGVTLLECAILMWMQYYLRSRIFGLLVSVIVFLLLVWTIADPIIYSLAGDHLTPSLLAHFAGFRIFESDYLWKPIEAHSVLVVSGIFGVVLLLTGCAICGRASMRAANSVTLRSCIFVTSFGTSLAAIPVAAGASYIEAPPEVIFALDWANIRNISSADISNLRSFVGLPAGAHWLDERYPLVYAPRRPAQARTTVPDIVIISIESLRGQDLRWVTEQSATLELPSLEALARNAVVFPHFVSNGFPSTEGFISTSASTWPHDRRRIVLDFKRINLDFISARLRSRGYRTVRVEDDPDFEDTTFWIERAFDEWITFAGRGLPAERDMVPKIKQFLADHDREKPGQPVFLDWKTANPHMPYYVPGDPPSVHADATPKANYQRSLLSVDAAIGALLTVLKARARANDTIVIVLGDHSNWLDSRRTTALPTDEMVWTGAIIAGSADWIGPARRDASHASQVDVMPTVLALAGDYRPTAALGRDLLAREPSRPVRAVVVRPGGLRLDENGVTLLVDRRHMHSGLRTRAFSADPQSRDALAGPALARYVETWARIIEQDKVWNPAILE